MTRLAPIKAALALGVGCLIHFSCASAASAEPRTQWDFIVRLDGKPIGTHRFTVSSDAAGERTVSSKALFEVKLLGWTAYRYHHDARERWAGECLSSIDAVTDDDGQRTQVKGRRSGGGLVLEVTDAPASSPHECLMSFAYWNPRLAAQRLLLDPGTGRVVPVRIEPLAPATIETDRGPASAGGWRISGLAYPIDVRYENGEWVGLDTEVRGGKRLTYRLR